MRSAGSVRRTLLGLTLLAGLTGCAGRYDLDTSDVAGPVGGQAPATARLQRQEFWFWYLPSREAVLTFRCGEQPLRASYTDEKGFAAVALPMPAEAGRHTLTLHHMDREGDEVSRSVGCYALQPQVLTLAVSLSALKDGDGSAEALQRLAEWGIQIVYLSESSEESEKHHAWLLSRNYPEGAVIGWHWNRKTSAVTGALPGVREQLPSLAVGAAGEDDDVRAFSRLNMAVAWIGAGEEEGVRKVSWAELAERIIAAKELTDVRDFSGVTAAEVTEQLGLGLPLAAPVEPLPEPTPQEPAPAEEVSPEPPGDQPQPAPVDEPAPLEELAPDESDATAPAEDEQALEEPLPLEPDGLE